MAGAFEELAMKAAKEKLTHEAFLYELVSTECEQREERKIARLLQRSGLPEEKTFRTLRMESFPLVARQQIERLKCGEFVDAAMNVIAVGRSGVGKTHLAVGIGRAACQAGHRVAFRPVPALVNEMLSAQHEYKLNALLKRLRSYDLVICDEFRYIPFSTEGAQLLFQFFSHRHSY